MGNMRIKLASIGVLALAACGGSGDEYAESEGGFAGAPELASMEADLIQVTASRTAKARPAPAPVPGDGGGTIDADVRMLAYQYGATLMLPVKVVGATLSAHETECLEAGPKVCQVISSNVSEGGEDYVYGNLEIRASRDWLANFRDDLPTDVEEAKGRLTAMSVQAEDLTRAITDTSARLDAQRTLRSRLLNLLEKDTDDVGDLLQIEREIARVQGEIESAESYLRILNARVSMDRMSLSYQTLPRAVTPQTAQPLVRAFTRFFGELSESLASLILFVAKALPWLIIGLPLFWVLLRFANRFRKNKS